MPVIKAGSGSKLGKTPKVSAFDSPGRVLGTKKATSDSDVAGNDPPVPVSKAPTAARLSEVPGGQLPKAASKLLAQPKCVNSPISASTSQISSRTPSTTTSAKSLQQTIAPLPKAISSRDSTMLKSSAIDATQPKSALVQPVLPQGWAAHQHPDGRFYYYNSVNRKSQWEIPAISAHQNATVKTQLPAHSDTNPSSSLNAQTSNCVSGASPVSNKDSISGMQALAVGPAQNISGQSLQNQLGLSELERYTISQAIQQASHPQVLSRDDYIDVSKREMPMSDEFGERKWFYRPCEIDCIQAKNNIFFPHTHSKEQGHFIKGETWWTGTPQQVTVCHPISEEKAAALTTMELLNYIHAIEIYPARRLILQDDNDCGWLDRGWITELGIALYQGRREHSVQILKDELKRQIDASVIPMGNDGEINEATLLTVEKHTPKSLKMLPVGRPPNTLPAAAQPKPPLSPISTNKPPLTKTNPTPNPILPPSATQEQPAMGLFHSGPYESDEDPDEPTLEEINAAIQEGPGGYDEFGLPVPGFQGRERGFRLFYGDVNYGYYDDGD